MKQPKRRYFMEDIYRIFVVYALIPITIITLITYGSIMIIWNQTIISRTAHKNVWMKKRLERVINDFIGKVDELTEDKNFYKALNDKKYKNAAYQNLYYFSNSIEEQVDFYVLDENLQMLAGSTREVPTFLPRDSHISWGITERMKDYPEEVILECNRAYKDNLSRTKLLIGKSIRVYGKIKGYLIFVLYGDEFIKTSGAELTHIIVTDSHDNLFLATSLGYTNSLDKIRNEFKEKNNYINIDGEKYYKKASSIIEGKIKVYTFTPVGRLYEIFGYVGIFIGVIIVILSMAMLYILKKLTMEKTKVINKVVDAFKEVQAGNLDVTLDINSYEEFEIIGKSYNLMLASIKELMVINEDKIRQTSLAEIKQLESQFNPHFLFNTLEHIKYTIKLDPNAASKMIVSLSTLLRYSISNGNLEITILEDLEYTKKYLLIQKYRFHERFNYEIYMERAAEECVVPKLILQPIIENAIKYGFGDRDELMVHIRISLLADDVVIVIYDDGIGMSSERLKEIKSLLNGEVGFSNHIGIYNVHRRIQLMYGKQYGIDLKSEINEGTVVKITLPIHKGAMKSAKSLDCRR